MEKFNKQKTVKGNIPYTVTPAGSLGLLALGDVGLRAWRKVRNEHKKKTKK